MASAFSIDCEPRTNLPARRESVAAIISLAFAVSVSIESPGASMRVGKNKTPARLSVCIDVCADKRRAGALCQKCREWRSRSEPSEEWRPQTVVAGMLIAENTDGASAAEQLDGAMKSFAAIEQFNSGAAADAAHVAVDVAIAELLINGAGPNITDKVRKQLREQFPVAEMAEHEDDRRSTC